MGLARAPAGRSLGGVQIEFSSTVYRWEARREQWCFVDVPLELSEVLRELPAPARGFGSIPVEVEVGGIGWRTSIFPSSGDGPYVLPLKKSVRDALGIALGDSVAVRLSTVGV